MTVGEAFVDRLYGVQAGSAADDFVVRRADGLYAYQLAVVVDDIAMQVTEVVRGADLLESTPRQIALYRALGASPPRFLHVPLIIGADGNRLAKRHGSTAIADYRKQGVAPERLVGALAASVGLAVPGEQLGPGDLIPRFDVRRLPAAATPIAGLPLSGGTGVWK